MEARIVMLAALVMLLRYNLKERARSMIMLMFWAQEVGPMKREKLLVEGIMRH